jgi:hypothetical protein
MGAWHLASGIWRLGIFRLADHILVLLRGELYLYEEEGGRTLMLAPRRTYHAGFLAEIKIKRLVSL